MSSSTEDWPRAGQLVGQPGATLGENVRSTLLELIMRGHFEEGHRLYPDHLAEQFGVSITPVREALMQLAAEGFIEAVQRRGFHVRTPDAQQIRNIWQVRQGLELTAGELCIDRLKAGQLQVSDFDVLVQLQERQQTRSEQIQHVEKLELNGRFHSQIVEFSGNPLLLSLYRSIQHKVLGSLVQRGLDSWRRRLDDESAEHWQIIKGLQTGSYETYRAAVRAHIARSLTDALIDLDARNNQKRRE
ncbi:GntR family transcriptional regulator [Devosia limi]|uniref:DNA-binding transcriptional regulator, GntR family n=1 Tax=Devosia limi DSM 17137 TaxID=1121477 RepID=A0A1M5D3L5_9HYPH|nr:GntR family transcriptional regulator [Devosia limi]SHF61475.1 DNA-binding transcriptional regulator, GntR family [Devosia limi DSM 17137]